MRIKLDIEHDYMQNKLIEIPKQHNIKVKDWHNNLFTFDKLKLDPNSY